MLKGHNQTWPFTPTPCLHEAVCCGQVFVVSTLASATPASPFLLRNYEHSAAGAAAAARLGASPPGASNFALWESLRASSAAAYYLDDFQRGDDRWACRVQAHGTHSQAVWSNASFMPSCVL